MQSMPSDCYTQISADGIGAQSGSERHRCVWSLSCLALVLLYSHSLAAYASQRLTPKRNPTSICSVADEQ